MVKWKTYLEILLVSTRLGLTSFGGPVAHLGYFQNEYIKKRKWLDEKSYADLIALCQFLPGPASSQVGISIGIIRGGLFGGLLSWIGFTMPSVIALVLFALLLDGIGMESASWIQGLKIVAVAVVAQAVLGMGKKLTPDRTTITIAVLAAIATLLFPTSLGQILIIVIAGLIGYTLFNKGEAVSLPDMEIKINRKQGIIALSLFFIMLFGLPVINRMFPTLFVGLFDIFFRVGSIVFGGGHVVLPLLEREVVPQGLISSESFLAGYGAAQAVPGPLFTFGSYLGAAIAGWKGAVIATVAIFLPSFLLVVGVLPFWNKIRKNTHFQAALTGINAAVVGILLAALYDPVWTSAILQPLDFILGLIAFTLLVYWKVPPWIVVVLTALGGIMISYV
ncbi:chromate efflux transporter [Bacillus aquiflavi]|uniref:chromate efflux transporter n=1 Tax=Bacillus aquiflavi TaxID=2672567 RepID=UPI001CA8E073|nr:chromate efflux transporter [Bacillus aquiflavi]UAC49779.1 chromate efflux transporter [Bacillus aquiflavi]